MTPSLAEAAAAAAAAAVAALTAAAAAVAISSLDHSRLGGVGAARAAGAEAGGVEMGSGAVGRAPSGGSAGNSSDASVLASLSNRRRFLRMVEFHRFLMALSVRPGRNLTMVDQRVP